VPRLSAYYSDLIADFRKKTREQVVGALSIAHGQLVEGEQLQAWLEEIDILHQATASVTGALLLEFQIPRLGSRIDAVVVAGPALFPIEFKCGEQTFGTAAYNQVWDYALDLKNFHVTSHAPPIFPILVATRATSRDPGWQESHPDGVRPPRRCRVTDLPSVIEESLASVDGPALDATDWASGWYEPTPTIVEAAQVLYSQHSVDAISRSDAGATNLRVTSRRVEEIIEASRNDRKKSIVFVTGVPGAGKTLVGLNVATRRQETHDVRSVYLSGNGPLVSVLQEALTRDEHERTKRVQRVGDIRRKVKLFIQNIHTFRDEGVRDQDRAPYDHVVIFDEAQRAWNKAKTADFMARRKGVKDFTASEPEFLVSYLNRHQDWATVVCLVGGGQEIYTGEAGISEWLDAILTQFPDWRVFVSTKLTGGDYGAGPALKSLGDRVNWDDGLHLSTSMRSFRAERVSDFVSAALRCDVDGARRLLKEMGSRYPIAITRDLDRAKEWIRNQARGSERYGLVASSQAQRLKPHAIDIRAKVDPVQWFLKERDDTRSSYYLEDAATEFQVQGLEVDWACVTWDADLRHSDGKWAFRSFKGNSWQVIRAAERQRYLLNAYRVLLTRARQGMVIFVPSGDKRDPTRPEAVYDETFGYLRALGIETL
jgi:hypothetical protein